MCRVIKGTVFLIESEITISDLLCSWMKGWGLEVLSFKNLIQCKKHLDRRSNILLIDLKEVNSENSNSVNKFKKLNIPIVVIARYVNYDIVENNDYFDICPFPCEPHQLRQIIKNATKYHHLYEDYQLLSTSKRKKHEGRVAIKLENDGKIDPNDLIKKKILPFNQLKKEAILFAYEHCNGNIFQASQKLKIGRATMYRLLHKYNII